jgi:hydroxypyruvate isomerase
MPQFSANLSYLFTEREFPERFAAARAAGFAGVEFHFPYAFDAALLAEAVMTSDLEVVLFNLPAGDWAAGERGIACHPGRMAEFQDGVGLAIDYAQALGCARLNCLAGLPPPGVGRDKALETLAENLRLAAKVLERSGIRLMLEPINNRDMPGFLVNTTAQALAAMDAAGCGNLFLQYDIYHAQVMEGDLARSIETHLPRIGHMQLADNPGRHEPGTGEINFDFLLRHIDRLGYQGWIGCEYKPRGLTEDSLGWLRAIPQ